MGGYPHLLLCTHYRASASHFYAFHRELFKPLLLLQFLLVRAHLLHLFAVYNYSRPRDGETRQRALAELLAGPQGPPQEAGEDPVLRGEAGEAAHEGGERVQEALTRLIKNLSAPQHPELRLLQHPDPPFANHHVHRYLHPLRQSPPGPYLQRAQTHQQILESDSRLQAAACDLLYRSASERMDQSLPSRDDLAQHAMADRVHFQRYNIPGYLLTQVHHHHHILPTHELSWAAVLGNSHRL